MKKHKFPIILILGIVFISISFILMVFMLVREYMGSANSKTIITEMEKLLPIRTQGLPEIYSNNNMPTLEINGIDYVAMIEIPSFDIILPITDKWDANNLPDSPSRFEGSVYNHTMVIGGADNSHQFGFCDKIETDSVITVTDMTGAQFTYAVTLVQRADDAEYTWLTDTNYDLTLFCRDTYTMEYIAVRCDFYYD
ncbi:MAG: sortase [Clostridia bacterium]|nr:sortase [Clostridia bacterium]